jgi:hypothetical protein
MKLVIVGIGKEQTKKSDPEGEQALIYTSLNF